MDEYEITEWLKRIVATPDKYELTDLGDNLYTIEPVPGDVTQAGTPLSEATLNKIEGIIHRKTQELLWANAAQCGNGVISGLEVTERGAGANLSVDVAAGKCQIEHEKYIEADTVNVELSAAHGTLDRWDLIVYRAGSEAPIKIDGTAATVPLVPTLEEGDIPLALVYRAALDDEISDAEILDKHIKVVECGESITASDVLIYANDTERSTTATILTKVKEIKIPHYIRVSSTYRIKFALRISNADYYALAKIFINGVAAGTQRSNGTTSPVTFSEDIEEIEAGDLIQVYAYTTHAYSSAYVSNFRLYGDAAFFVGDYTDNDPE